MKRIFALLLSALLLTGCMASSPEVTETAPTQTESDPIPLNVFVPNDNADGFCTMPVVIDEADPQTVLAMLIENSMLAEEIRLNSAVVEGSQLNLDFNQAFLDQLLTYGTAGERMMIGCVVNTYLSVYDVQTVYITVEGETMESGHVVYDFPMEYFE